MIFILHLIAQNINKLDDECSCLSLQMDLLLADELTDEELLLLEMDKQKGGNHIRFTLDDMNDQEVQENFRFQRRDLGRLITCLRFPEYFTTKTNIKFCSEEVLCILLRRLTYRNRFVVLYPLFGRSKSQLSEMFNIVLDHVYNNFSHLLSTLAQPWIINGVPQFAAAVFAQNAPLVNCWGFIDGTVRAICRPSLNQREVYNGHKRCHALKFQAVMAPNGIVANLQGPYEGRRHDSFLLHESDMLTELSNLLGGQYCVYGDPAYPLHRCLITPFPDINLTPQQPAFNGRMSAVRQCVE